MKRAAILIGVDKTGNLPKLRDAASGAEHMAKWAQAQEIDTVHLITDKAGPVDVATIKKVIRALVDAADVSQLIVYFAGHGVNLQRQEYWLLSGAPDDTQAAVNVAGSVALAATCGIPHIVLISDACRTAAEGIQAQSVRGSEIFPNREGDATPVDQFFACDLGRPSHEVKDPAVTSAEFKALYTNELIPALRGDRKDVVEWKNENGTTVGHVHLRPLRDHLKSAVAAKLKDLQLQTKVIQVPTAIISSDPPTWLSQVKERSAGRGGLSFGLPPRSDATRGGGSPRAPSLSDNIAVLAATTGSGATAPQEAALHESVTNLAAPFGVTHHETQCGFKIRGARIVRVESFSTRCDINTMQDDVRVHAQQRANVLLVLDSGDGVLLPALPGFLGALTVEDGELIDVAYEPSEYTSRWSDFQQRAPELRALRAIIASSMSRGIFRLEGDDALEIGRRMQYSKFVDPSLAIYAAYVYHDLQQTKRIRDMEGYLRSDINGSLFDVSLLARTLKGEAAGDSWDTTPIPLHAQGWALLSAFGVSLIPELCGIDAHLRPSLWTLFDPVGVHQIQQAIQTGVLK